jgi:hypothetical protein
MISSAPAGTNHLYITEKLYDKHSLYITDRDIKEPELGAGGILEIKKKTKVVKDEVANIEDEIRNEYC